MNPIKSSNPIRIARLEETIKVLKELGVEEVYIEVADPDNIGTSIRLDAEEKAVADNPLVAVTLRFKDGAALCQVFTTPIPQSKAMAALGRMW